jgi:2-polyprenyl-6-methoxyphenol hydroxylase-like FAD-dependent oxidoreductase
MMGMAIGDGYFLARSLKGVDLRDLNQSALVELYEKPRTDYVNHNMEFARILGTLFHQPPWPFAKLRDVLFDYTAALSRVLQTGYLEKAETETTNLKELQVL